MNSTKFLSRFVALALLFVAMQGSVFAKDPKTVKKARKAVEEAAPHDWQTYAEAASMCFKKSVNWEEALDWVEKSVEIRETAFNLEVMGDYYLKNKMPAKAIEYYIKSMDKARAIDVNSDLRSQQAKIRKADRLL